MSKYIHYFILNINVTKVFLKATQILSQKCHGSCIVNYAVLLALGTVFLVIQIQKNFCVLKLFQLLYWFAVFLMKLKSINYFTTG